MKRMLMMVAVAIVTGQRLGFLPERRMLRSTALCVATRTSTIRTERSL